MDTREGSTMKLKKGDMIRNEQNGVEGIILNFRGPFPKHDIPKQAVIYVTYTPFTRSLRLHSNLSFNLCNLRVIGEDSNGT